MPNALIGFSGFVGSTLQKQKGFKSQYRSENIGDIGGKSFDTVVCAGAPAQKWIAIREPEADRQKIEGLIARLKTFRCKTFILISTVDVFSTAHRVDEDTPINESDLHAYGLHRRLLEKFVESHFLDYLIVRLPGLVGPGLRKNVIYDLLNDNNLQKIDSRDTFQFYPMVNLWYDIQAARGVGLKLVHFTAEPITVANLSQLGFGRPFHNTSGNSIASYDMQTKHSDVFGRSGPYQYSARETIQAVRTYAQSEPLNIKIDKGTNI